MESVSLFTLAAVITWIISSIIVDVHWVGIEGLWWSMLVLEGEVDDLEGNILMMEYDCSHVGYDESNSKDIGWHLLDGGTLTVKLDNVQEGA